LAVRLEALKLQDKLLEAQRLMERTRYDIEMMREMGFCSGIENYSRHISGRPPGSTPFTLIDYFDRDFLIIVDESHASIPQVRGMYEGDRSRKTTLVEFGFRLPSALDNRPLRFNEFESKINQMLFVSATPSVYERDHSVQTVEQIIRPTGLLDPEIFIRPVKGQIDNLISEIRHVTGKNQKVLITTLTKKMAEDLTNYLKEAGIRVRYLHSDIDTLERLEIIRDLRMNEFDVLVGINLLREGLDIPEVSLVAILDADKQGFLRNETSLIQTIGRAARHVEGRVVMYADGMTDSMQRAVSETNRRRHIQELYNTKHGIIPKSIVKKVREIIQATAAPEEKEKKKKGLLKDPESMSREELQAALKKMEKEMKQAAAELQFERAAMLRDEIIEVKKHL
jgi:excinuclease ABC subunit B